MSPMTRLSRVSRTPRFAAVTLVLTVIGPAAPPAFSQVASPLFVDDSPLAADGLIRAGELAAMGNLDEAIRVLQIMLDSEGDRLLAVAGEPDLFTSVRGRVHGVLLGHPGLLERYRTIEEPRARQALEEGRIDEVERVRLLTPSGFEAALRLAQRRIEAAQFHAAVQTLSQLDSHPDRTGDGAHAAADLLTLAASYLNRELSEAARSRLNRWRIDATQPAWDETPAAAPEQHPSRSALSPIPACDLQDLLPRPLWSDSIGERLPLESAMSLRSMPNPPREGALWLYAVPTVVGDNVYASDTQTITSWNRLSLSQRWRVRIDGLQGARYAIGINQGFEELTTVAADATHVVALMGLAIQNIETPRRSILCLDQATGLIRWSRLLEDYRIPELEESRFKGPLILDQGVVVVLVEKDLTRRRLEGIYAIGISAATGDLLWVRLLGSSGSLAYGYRPSLIDAPAAHRGVLYITNRLGFIAAVESASGRVRWIRRWPGSLITQSRTEQPWQASTPLIVGDDVFSLTSNRQEIIRLDGATGMIRARCPASRFDNPDYLIATGSHLVGVSASMLTSAELSGFGPDVQTTRIARMQTGQIRGRAIAFGDHVLVPMIDGLAVFDPSQATDPVVRLTLDKPGNVLPMNGHLLVMDDREIHTYLVWEVAERMLRERMDADPRNPSPAITYAELSYRAGRTEGLLSAVDRALAAVESDPLAPSASADQSRLFRALFAMIEPAPESSTRTMLTVQQRGALLDRLDRCAGSVAERVSFLLAAGRFYEAIDQPSRAVDAYQTILDSKDLSSSTFSQGKTSVNADYEATRRLRRVIQTHGRGLYDSYQADADRALAALSTSLDPEPFENLARRYPVARASVSAWLEAASRYTSQGRTIIAAQALEEGLAAARQALEPGDPVVGELTGRLVRHLMRSERYIPARAALESFGRSQPVAAMTENGRPLDPLLLAEECRTEIERIDRRPAIGPEPRGVSSIIGWSVLPPLAEEVGAAVHDRLLMISEHDEISMFKDTGPGSLTKIWEGIRDGNEHYLWMDAGGVCFGRETGEGERSDIRIIRRHLDTGAVLWETPPFRTLFPRAAIDELLADPGKEFIPVIDTPLESRVPVISVTLHFDRRTLVLIDRLGRAAAIDLETGRILWTHTGIVPRVHDAVVSSGTLLVGGGDAPVDLDRPIADAHAGDPMTGIVTALDARTGQTLYRWETEERVRWVRVTPEGFPVIGTEEAVVSLDAYRGRVRWRASARPIGASMTAWTLPGRIIVRADDQSLYQLATEDGAMSDKPLDTRDRLRSAAENLRVRAMGEHAALTTPMGLAVYGPDGALIGLDANERESIAFFADFGQRFALSLTPVAALADDSTARVNINTFALPTLRIVSRSELPVGMRIEPGPCAIIDGKLLISSGAVTTVIDLPDPALTR